MAQYFIKGKRFNRLYKAESLTPTYAAAQDATIVANSMCDVPWTATDVKQATLPAHAGGQNADEQNLANREYFDAALFCAEHKDGKHRAYANAVCYRFSIPTAAQGKTLTKFEASINCDPYNAAGARVALYLSDTPDIPTECSVCRNGIVKAEGVAPRITRDGNWYANSAVASLTLNAALKKYAFLFVTMENYQARAAFLEGAAYALPKFSITTSAAVSGWTDGETYDLAGGQLNVYRFDTNIPQDMVVVASGLSENSVMVGIDMFPDQLELAIIISVKDRIKTFQILDYRSDTIKATAQISTEVNYVGGGKVSAFGQKMDDGLYYINVVHKNVEGLSEYYAFSYNANTFALERQVNYIISDIPSPNFSGLYFYGQYIDKAYSYGDAIVIKYGSSFMILKVAGVVDSLEYINLASAKRITGFVDTPEGDNSFIAEAAFVVCGSVSEINGVSISNAAIVILGTYQQVAVYDVKVMPKMSNMAVNNMVVRSKEGFGSGVIKKGIIQCCYFGKDVAGGRGIVLNDVHDVEGSQGEISATIHEHKFPFVKIRGFANRLRTGVNLFYILAE